MDMGIVGDKKILGKQPFSHAMENIAINSILKTLSKNDSSVVLLWGSNPHHSIFLYTNFLK